MESKSAIKIPAVLKTMIQSLLPIFINLRAWNITYVIILAYLKINFADVIEKILFTKEFGFILPINKLGLKILLFILFIKKRILKKKFPKILDYFM